MEHFYRTNWMVFGIVCKKKLDKLELEPENNIMSSSLLKGWEASAKKDIKAVGSEIETVIVYSADTAISNVKSEVSRLESLIESKVESIVAHNKNILGLQSTVKALEDEVTKAKALKDKITAAVS